MTWQRSLANLVKFPIGMRVAPVTFCDVSVFAQRPLRLSIAFTWFGPRMVEE